MRITLFALLAATCVLADESRGSKRPYIADAVGNILPPPSSGPATVGSPVNLLTPDRYEFYTFDESGELVKRLMTLQEIQAIVAAGEEAEGMVTFANDNQPTIAFNFSQPPYTKVHSVVTNVQNVLKAQMEAHKNNPQTNPTLDTPDVSDSWSLILPSIFGNTGVDISPDKTSGSFSTPETETFEFDRINFDDNLSKEGGSPISSSATVQKENEKPAVTQKMPPTTELIQEVTTTSIPTTKVTTTTTTTPKPTTTTTTTPKPTTTTTTPKPTTTTTTTIKPTTSTTSTTTTTTTTTTTVKPTTSTSTTSKPSTTTTNKPRTTPTTKRTTTSTTPTSRATSTAKPTTTAKPVVKITPKTTTIRPYSTTRRHVSNSTPITNEAPTTLTGFSTERSSPIYEKISTFIPVSTAAYVTERSTHKPIQTTTFISTHDSTTKKTFVSPSKNQLSTMLPEKKQPTITTYKPTSSTPLPVLSTVKTEDLDKDNATTITTQSVSPSTTVSSTEFMSVVSSAPGYSENNAVTEDSNDIKVNEPNIHLFDVAQSISQIASDLGSTNYQPIPTTSDLLEATNAINMDLESKDSLELDIPSDSKNEPENKIPAVVDKQESDNFVKISTIPRPQNDDEKPSMKDTPPKINEQAAETTAQPESVTTSSTGTPIDPILSESMDDLLSQVVNQAPQSLVDNENNYKDQNKISTTENTVVASTTVIIEDIKTTSENYIKINSSVTTEKAPQNESDSEKTTSTDNKESLREKEQEIKKQESDNFVKIPSPTQNNVTQVSYFTESNEKQEKPVISENSTQVYQTLSADKQNNNIAVIIAPGEQPKENVSTSTETASQQQILQKTNVEHVNQLSDKVENNNEDKELVSLPKVDEFKKKIQKVNIDYKEIANERNNSWKLISTVSPPKANEIPKDKFKTDNYNKETPDKDIVLDFSKENQGLEVTTKDLGEDIAQFTELCNELAFRYWNAVVENIPTKRSFVLSPFSVTSMLAMLFMGAKGATSGEMNEILKLDDMVTFNPHFTLKNISDSIETIPDSGVAVSAFIRELYSDRNKGKILTFYKERAQHFYNGHVEEINFKLISDIIRRRTNLLVKRYTWGKIIEYMKANTITMQPPLAALSTNIFQTDCTGSSVEGRDGEMYFVVSPNVRQRRLVPVPAVLYKKGFLAGYDPVLDATAAALGNTNSIISTLFLMPGQQGNVVHAEDLEALEKRLLDSNPSTPAWNRLLRTLLPRIGLELQIPRFSHKSIFNISSTLKKMGLKDLFDADHADLGGLNGPSKDLYLSDMIQSTTFVTCGEGVIGEQHHIEEYPESLELTRRRRTSRWSSSWDEPRDYQRAFHDPHDVGEAMNLPLHLRPRQARLPARNAQPARLKFDRPFLYFVRHNPSGMILYVGRYNPRLLP